MVHSVKGGSEMETCHADCGVQVCRMSRRLWCISLPYVTPTVLSKSAVCHADCVV